jgi:hypothetical protein
LEILLRWKRISLMFQFQKFELTVVERHFVSVCGAAMTVCN